MPRFCCQAPGGLRLGRDGLRQVLVIVQSYLMRTGYRAHGLSKLITPIRNAQSGSDAASFALWRRGTIPRLCVRGGGDGIRTRVQTRTVTEYRS